MSQADANPNPDVSIVIPIYNEEGILRGSVLELREKLRPFGFSYELLLCENGSRDRTVEIGKEIEVEHPEVRMLSIGKPNYGLAMKTGILEARGGGRSGMRQGRAMRVDRREEAAGRL